MRGKLLARHDTHDWCEQCEVRWRPHCWTHQARCRRQISSEEFLWEGGERGTASRRPCRQGTKSENLKNWEVYPTHLISSGHRVREMRCEWLVWIGCSRIGASPLVPAPKTGPTARWPEIGLLTEALNCELCYPPPTLFRAREGEQPKDAAFMAETRHIASSIHRLSLSLFLSTLSFLSQSLWGTSLHLLRAIWFTHNSTLSWKYHSARTWNWVSVSLTEYVYSFGMLNAPLVLSYTFVIRRDSLSKPLRPTMEMIFFPSLTNMIST